MTKKYKKEVHGILKSGERIYLGSGELSYEESQEFLTLLAQSSTTWFNVRYNLYFKDAFAGIQVEPFTDEELND